MTPKHDAHVSRTINDDEAASTATIMAVAESVGTAPTELPPLAEAIDPEALDDLFASAGQDTRLTFTYDGVQVTLEADEVVTVETASVPAERDVLG